MRLQLSRRLTGRSISSTRRRVLRLAGTAQRLRGSDRPIDRGRWYRERWLAAAAERGLEAEDLGGGFVRIAVGRDPLLVQGAHVGLDDIATYRLAGDKRISDRLLRGAGLPVPGSRAFDLGDRELAATLRRDGHRLVVKPAADTGGGQGVTVGPVGRSAARRAVLDAAAHGGEVLCQDLVPGRALRVLVLDGVALDAVERSPASVRGNGADTVMELVRAEDLRRRALGPGATGYIGTGADLHAALARAGVAPDDRPAAGVPIVVAGRSNTGSEHESHRVPLAAEVAEVAVTAARALGVRLAGVDVILDGGDALQAVLEVNTCPGLHWHHLVAGEGFNSFGAILDGCVAATR